MERVGGGEARTVCGEEQKGGRRGRTLKFLHRPGRRSQPAAGGRASGANPPPAAGHPPRCSVSVASPRLTVTSSNYRACEQIPIETKYKKRRSEQVNQVSSFLRSGSILRPHPFSATPSSSSFPCVCPGAAAKLPTAPPKTPQARAAAAARSAGGERHGRRALGAPQYSACRRLISSGPVAVDRCQGCR